LYLQADHAGDYDGLSAQFSGDGFSDMGFTVHAVAQGDFTDWIAKVQQAGPVLDRAGYAELSRQDKAQAFTYREADPSLFHAVVTQEIPPQAGPNTASAAPGVHPTSEH
jgi:cytochrome o ubiquinol oxidase subunit 2